MKKKKKRLVELLTNFLIHFTFIDIQREEIVAKDKRLANEVELKAEVAILKSYVASRDLALTEKEQAIKQTKESIQAKDREVSALQNQIQELNNEVSLIYSTTVFFHRY